MMTLPVVMCSLMFAAIAAGDARSATIVVAAADSAEKSKAAADYVCGGESDQEQINAAIVALPPAGGTVLLMEGTYDMRRAGERLGCVMIERSNVVLAGQGAATKLELAPKQNINVVRIIGGGVSNVTVRDLYIDANRAENDELRTTGGERFEVCGIKAWHKATQSGDGAPVNNITVRNCYVYNAQRLGIMLFGRNVRVFDSFIGNAGSDAIELLIGPGEIRGNHFDITGQTHVAVGSDAGNNILMVNNIVHVHATGRLDIGFRSWAGSLRHVIAGNVLTVDQGGVCTLAMDIRGTQAAVTGNTVHTHAENEPTRLKITGGHTVVTGNVLDNVIIEVDDTTGGDKPIIVRNNIMNSSSIEHKKGLLQTDQ